MLAKLIVVLVENHRALVVASADNHHALLFGLRIVFVLVDDIAVCEGNVGLLDLHVFSRPLLFLGRVNRVIDHVDEGFAVLRVLRNERRGRECGLAFTATEGARREDIRVGQAHVFERDPARVFLSTVSHHGPP